MKLLLSRIPISSGTGTGYKAYIHRISHPFGKQASYIITRNKVDYLPFSELFTDQLDIDLKLGGQEYDLQCSSAELAQTIEDDLLIKHFPELQGKPREKISYLWQFDIKDLSAKDLTVEFEVPIAIPIILIRTYIQDYGTTYSAFAQTDDCPGDVLCNVLLSDQSFVKDQPLKTFRYFRDLLLNKEYAEMRCGDKKAALGDELRAKAIAMLDKLLADWFPEYEATNELRPSFFLKGCTEPSAETWVRILAPWS